MVQMNCIDHFFFKICCCAPTYIQKYGCGVYSTYESKTISSLNKIPESSLVQTLNFSQYFRLNCSTLTFYLIRVCLLSVVEEVLFHFLLLLLDGVWSFDVAGEGICAAGESRSRLPTRNNIQSALEYGNG